MTHQERPNRVRWVLVYVVPPIALLLIVFAMAGAIMSRKPPEVEKELEPIVPKVETLAAKPETITVKVESQGVVQARTETTLMAEVSGRVISVSPALYAGGFFKEGDVLVEIDPVEYEANLSIARSQLSEAQVAYEQELATSQQAKEDWEAMGRTSEPSDLALRKPQLARARAALDSTAARVRIAERDLERAKARAPYDGRAREKLVDLGQNVMARSTPLARIYSVDTVEIRLPIASADLQYLDLPEIYADGSGDPSRPGVSLTVAYGSRDYTWAGEIVRTEGAIDPTTRLTYVVAQVKDPYARDSSSDRPPLKVGMFAKATIDGETIGNAFRIPRRALRANETVHLVDPENRLSIRKVEVYQTDTGSAIISSGLKAGDRVSLTPLEYAVDGMQVGIEQEAETTATFEEARAAEGVSP